MMIPYSRPGAGPVVLPGRDGLGQGGRLVVRIGVARLVVIAGAVGALSRCRAARARVGDRYQNGGEQHDCDRHQGLLPPGDSAGGQRAGVGGQRGVLVPAGRRGRRAASAAGIAAVRDASTTLASQSRMPAGRRMALMRFMALSM